MTTNWSWNQPPIPNHREAERRGTGHDAVMISALLNILWVVLGGFVMALGWWLAGLLCAITIIGLPWARSCF